MTTPILAISKASPADSRAIWAWRNDPHTRAMSLSAGEIPWEAHSAWFEATLSDADRLVLVGRLEGEPGAVGICRFDIDRQAGTAEVSINLNPALRGRGLARPLLVAAIAAFWADHPMPLSATIRPENASSIRVFTGCGFALTSVDVGTGRYRLVPEVGRP